MICTYIKMFAEQEDKSERLIFTFSMISQTLLIVGYIYHKRVEINGRMKSSVNYLQSQQLLLLLLLINQSRSSLKTKLQIQESGRAGSNKTKSVKDIWAQDNTDCYYRGTFVTRCSSECLFLLLVYSDSISTGSHSLLLNNYSPGLI